MTTEQTYNKDMAIMQKQVMHYYLQWPAQRANTTKALKRIIEQMESFLTHQEEVTR